MVHYFSWVSDFKSGGAELPFASRAFLKIGNTSDGSFRFLDDAVQFAGERNSQRNLSRTLRTLDDRTAG